jgi:hypothetical protein
MLRGEEHVLTTVLTTTTPDSPPVRAILHIDPCQVTTTTRKVARYGMQEVLARLPADHPASWPRDMTVRSPQVCRGVPAWVGSVLAAALGPPAHPVEHQLGSTYDHGHGGCDGGQIVHDKSPSRAV